jgi:hypothetical protein
MEEPVIRRFQRRVKSDPHRGGPTGNFAASRSAPRRARRPRGALAARLAQASAQRGIGDQPGQRIGEGRDGPRLDQEPGDAVLDQLRYAGNAGRHAGELLALRLQQDIGEPVAVAVGSNAAG